MKVSGPTKSTPKQHHYVPEMLLHYFTDNRGKLYFFNKRFAEKGVLASPPNKLFKENHLYTAYDNKGNKDVTLERSFSELEEETSIIIKKIVLSARNGILPNLNLEEKETWNQFVYYQWKRVPDCFEKLCTANYMQTQIQQAIQVFEATQRPITTAEIKEIQDPETVKRLVKNCKTLAIAKPSQKVVDILMQKGIAVGIITNPSKSFIIGSFPIVKLNKPGHAHLMDPTVEAWFPIAHDVIVSPSPTPPQERLIQFTDNDHIRYINEAIAKQSTMIAGRSKKLIASLSIIC